MLKKFFFGPLHAEKIFLRESEHPTSTFAGILRGEELRIRRRHTDHQAAAADIRKFHIRLQARGWPISWIRQQSSKTHRKSRRIEHSRTVILRLPFRKQVKDRLLRAGMRKLQRLVRSHVMLGWKLGTNNFLKRYASAWLYKARYAAP